MIFGFAGREKWELYIFWKFGLILAVRMVYDWEVQRFVINKLWFYGLWEIDISKNPVRILFFKEESSDNIHWQMRYIDILYVWKERRREMSIASDLIRGHTDVIILAQLIKKDSYGYEINKVIQHKSKGMYELK